MVSSEALPTGDRDPHLLKCAKRNKGRETWQHDMNAQILADVNVTLHEIVKRSVVVSAGCNANETGWKNTRAKETFGADSDDVSV